MLSLILAALAGAQTVDPAMVRSPLERNCNASLARTSTILWPGPHRLGDLPPGIMQLAVDKRVAGCGVTVLPRRDETGQHMMIMGPRPDLYQTPTRSKPQRRLQRHR